MNQKGNVKSFCPTRKRGENTRREFTNHFQFHERILETKRILHTTKTSFEFRHRDLFGKGSPCPRRVQTAGGNDHDLHRRK